MQSNLLICRFHELDGFTTLFIIAKASYKIINHESEQYILAETFLYRSIPGLIETWSPLAFH